MPPFVERPRAPFLRPARRPCPTRYACLSHAIIDHRGPEFALLTRRVLDASRHLQDRDPSSSIPPLAPAPGGSLVNALSPGDHVLM